MALVHVNFFSQSLQKEVGFNALLPDRRGWLQGAQGGANRLDRLGCGETSRQAQDTGTGEGVAQAAKAGDEIGGIHAATRRSR